MEKQRESGKDNQEYERIQLLKKIGLFVLDMDGTIYLGDRLFPFTKGFLERVRQKGGDLVKNYHFMI